MRIIIEEPLQNEEDEIIVRCKALDESLLKLIYKLKNGNQTIIGIKDGEMVRIEPKVIYYFEAVDHKVFLYTATEVYEIKQKLYELEQLLENTDFFRASKSVILNLRKVKALKPAFSGRLEAALDNGEKVIISRQYVGDLKSRLGL